uniref:NADH dehydrogenase subunit 2 n=1 Tax=Haemaphysalis sulcata TaxID=490559 RepID=UPI001FAEC717|nr:NADH dehydrogenase subunit 2 [Haemaphysalis sulcata]UNO53923.1 NADH dehydrogenase subunit 2 [Haemaphysalis sulcata]
MFFKNLMKWLIMITIVISISSKNWFIFWIMMEMNMMMFIPILKQNKLQNCNSMITYFIVQSFSSIMFFMFSMMTITNFSVFNETLIVISLMIKLAMIPFHSWLILISETLDYNSLMIILSMQKVIPLFILSKMKTELSFIFSMISLIFSSIMIFNLKFLKKILIFSSISHMSWMIIIMNFMSNFWMTYMFIYFFMILMLTKFLLKSNVFLIYDLMKLKMTNSNKIGIIVSLLSLGGVPPFIGFVIKFLAINIIIKYSIISMMILITSSLLNIFIYIRMITPILLTFNNITINFNLFKIIKNFIFYSVIIITLILMNLIF